MKDRLEQLKAVRDPPWGGGGTGVPGAGWDPAPGGSGGNGVGVPETPTHGAWGCHGDGGPWNPGLGWMGTSRGWMSLRPTPRWVGGGVRGSLGASPTATGVPGRRDRGGRSPLRHLGAGRVFWGEITPPGEGCTHPPMLWGAMGRHHPPTRAVWGRGPRLWRGRERMWGGHGGRHPNPRPTPHPAPRHHRRFLLPRPPCRGGPPCPPLPGGLLAPVPASPWGGGGPSSPPPCGRAPAWGRQPRQGGLAGI